MWVLTYENICTDKQWRNFIYVPSIVVVPIRNRFEDLKVVTRWLFSGIYNPSGSTHPVRFYLRNYQHHFDLPQQLSKEDRDLLLGLRVVERGRVTKLTLSQNSKFLCSYPEN